MRALCFVFMLAVGCHHAAPTAAPADAAPADRCGPAVDHVFDVMTSLAKEKLGFGERMMMKAVASQTAGECRKKGGLSDAQAACILAVKTADDLKALKDCPALKEHPLTWISLDDPDGGMPSSDAGPPHP